MPQRADRLKPSPEIEIHAYNKNGWTHLIGQYVMNKYLVGFEGNKSVKDQN